MKLDFKQWLTSQYRTKFYENFRFDRSIPILDLKWIAENTSRNELGDAFYLEIKDEIISRCFEAITPPQKPATGRQYIYSKITKPLGELMPGEDVGVSKANVGVWEVISLDSNKRAFAQEQELAAYVKSVRNETGPITAPSIEELKKLVAPLRKTAPAAPKGQENWIYAKVKSPIEAFKEGDNVAVSQSEDGMWGIWSFDGAKMTKVKKADLSSYVQSVKKDPADPKSIYSAPSLHTLYELVASQLEKPKDDKNGKFMKYEDLSEEQQKIDARFEQMMKSPSQSHMMINALAGTGKTTMLKHLAWKYGKPGQKWLYLVFNTKNKVEAQEKFPTTIVDVRTTNGFLGNLLGSDKNVTKIDQTERLIQVLSKRKKGAHNELDSQDAANSAADEAEEDNTPMPRSKMGELVDGPAFASLLQKLNIPENEKSEQIIKGMHFDEYSQSAAIGCAKDIRYTFKEEAQRLADLAKAYGVDPRKNETSVRTEIEKIFDGYDLDHDLVSVKERIQKYKNPSMIREVQAALKKILGHDFMPKNYKDQMADAAIWLLKASLPHGTDQVLNYKGVDYDLGAMRDFSDDIWLSAINAHDMHWPHYDVVLADEVQDFNPCQKLMLQKLHEAGAKIVAVGDPNQAIYRFRGADGDAFSGLGNMLKQLSTDKDTEQSLTTNYRSKKNILDHVNNHGHVTGLKHSEKKYPGGGGGVVTNQEHAYDDVFATLKKEHNESKKPGGKPMAETAFIARTNEPLVQAALRMLGDGTPFVIVGRDVSSELMKHINRVLKEAKLKDTSPAIPHPRAAGAPNLGQKLESYQERENKRWGSMNSKKSHLQEVNATSEALYAALASFSGMSRNTDEMDQGAYDSMMRNVATKPVPTVKQFKEWLKSKLSGFDVQDKEDDLKAFREKVKKEHPVVLTTAHKSKGLEFSRVYVLREDQFPHPKATRKEDLTQEENARYVSHTRAEDELHIIKLKGQPGYKEPGGED